MVGTGSELYIDVLVGRGGNQMQRRRGSVFRKRSCPCPRATSVDDLLGWARKRVLQGSIRGLGLTPTTAVWVGRQIPGDLWTLAFKVWALGAETCDLVQCSGVRWAGSRSEKAFTIIYYYV